ncbi:hypothetical protein DUNSADRAFT_9169 [Dunaliella salina]|uniref:Uncharacterized protein n=1 Tax=Dunaliella salina TaxID=3046 RepID=A0ABQ7GI28_DUNSA|nr:hypothetical protein DUNSADRAFT_9169 [Dunaliella salina]|eukprot:KAF5834257.1 hypothetical protein DUNSADRAFT_9169 [Dunaliella salina]
MRADQRAATNRAVPADSEAATATRLATRALRAADRESVRDRDDYALATYGVVFNALTPVQMEDVANYMRNDEKRAYGAVLPGGEAADAKRQADANYAAMPAGDLTGTMTGVAGTTAGTTAGATMPPVGYGTTGATVYPPGTAPTGTTRAI